MASEARDEELAPAAQRMAVAAADGTLLREALAERSQWDDPDDINERSKEPWQVRGFRRVSVLRNLHLRSGLITQDHLDAELSLDYEWAMGARPGYERPEVGTTGLRAFSGPAEAQMRALARYREAVQAVGQRLCVVLLPVVLMNTTLGEIARRLGMEAVPPMVSRRLLWTRWQSITKGRIAASAQCEKVSTYA